MFWVFFFGNMESYMELSCNFEDRDLGSPAYLNILCLVGFCVLFFFLDWSTSQMMAISF